MQKKGRPLQLSDYTRPEVKTLFSIWKRRQLYLLSLTQPPPDFFQPENKGKKQAPLHTLIHWRLKETSHSTKVLGRSAWKCIEEEGTGPGNKMFTITLGRVASVFFSARAWGTSVRTGHFFLFQLACWWSNSTSSALLSLLQTLDSSWTKKAGLPWIRTLWRWLFIHIQSKSTATLWVQTTVLGAGRTWQRKSCYRCLRASTQWRKADIEHWNTHSIIQVQPWRSSVFKEHDMSVWAHVSLQGWKRGASWRKWRS